MRSSSFLVLAVGLLALGGCAHLPRPHPDPSVLVVRLPRPAPELLEGLRLRAVRSGFRIAGESADSVHVDFGVSLVDLPVPESPGDAGSPVLVRRTEVHADAVFQVSPLEGGSVVTLHDRPIYWHPEARGWFPAPRGLAPGIRFLAQVAGRASEEFEGLGSILRPMRNYMTRTQYERHRKLVEETENKLNAAQKKVGEAASHGDLSENAEYDAAVEECAFYSGRLEELHVQMIGVDIVDPRNTIEGMVTIGKTVEIEDLETEERRVHHIVGNGTLDSGRGEVSYAAPFGAALIGHGEGEEVTIALPAGQQRVRIVSIAVTE